MDASRAASRCPTIPHAFAAQVSGLAALGLGETWLRQVLWDNGTRLFGL